ncbi:MAG: endonuclease III [Desulfuromonadales bacterium C00003096]|nr:MAG: endonuclease III [Desulfuromonadales bacterium C00003096]
MKPLQPIKPSGRPAMRKKAARILDQLYQLYPDAHCALIYDNPFQLLIATILSAQCTDVQVNKVTVGLFAKYSSVQALAEADLQTLEGDIRSTGFYRNKAKSLLGCAQMLLREYDGQVPQTLSELVRLPGVGRKTANVVLGNVFGIPGMVVDTHVKRLSRRFAWTDQQDPEKIEEDLSQLLPRKHWVQASHLLIYHGRQLCKAPIPFCSRCPLLKDCPQRGVDRAN